MALGGAPKRVVKEAVRLKCRKAASPFPCAIAANLGHRALCGVIAPEQRHPAKEGEGRVVSVTKRFRRLRRISLGKEPIRRAAAPSQSNAACIRASQSRQNPPVHVPAREPEAQNLLQAPLLRKHIIGDDGVNPAASRRHAWMRLAE